MYFNQRGNISTLNGSSLKLIDKFTYLGSSVSLTKTDINTRLAKAWTAIDRLLVIWKSDWLYGCTMWMLTKRMEEKFDGHNKRMLWAILNKSWRQHPTKQQINKELHRSILTIMNESMIAVDGSFGRNSQMKPSCKGCPSHISCHLCARWLLLLIHWHILIFSPARCLATVLINCYFSKT